MSEKKIAWVTGASRGIGKSILLKLAADGFYVVGTATSDSGVASIKKYLQENNFIGAAYLMNLQDTDSIAACYKAIKDDVGAPAILVNNAGITRDGLFLRMKEADWLDVIQTNLTGLFHTCKLAARGMFKARYGRIINISSVVANMGNPGQCNYAASKGGIVAFSKSLARELASLGITVNCVTPGLIDTDMSAEIDKDYLAKMLEAVPMARMGNPEDISAAVSYLASDAAGYVTGSTIHVNGGMLME
jgi:3-oxoacyl-[acyl-carrier protein] reductase